MKIQTFELTWRKSNVPMNTNEGRTDVATLISMYIAHMNCRKTLRPRAAASQIAPKTTFSGTDAAPYSSDSGLVQTEHTSTAEGGSFQSSLSLQQVQ